MTELDLARKGRKSAAVAERLTAMALQDARDAVERAAIAARQAELERAAWDATLDRIKARQAEDKAQEEYENCETQVEYDEAYERLEFARDLHERAVQAEKAAWEAEF
jgi:hypothetical protein